MKEKILLYFVVFITGTCVMMLELAGSRVIAPYFGTSTITWTALISVILGSLSLGYFIGGFIADKKPNYKVFSLLLFLSGISILLFFLLKDALLIFISNSITNIRLSTLLGTTILFFIPNILLGTIVPFSTKLSLSSLRKTGEVTGMLYAISTIGSIFGTILTGFYLLELLGNSQILFLVSILLLLTTTLVIFIKVSKNFSLLLLILILLISYWAFTKKRESSYVLDKDTAYNRVRVFKYTDEKTGRPVLALETGYEEIQSAMFLDNDNDLVHEYKKFFRLAGFFNPNIKKSLAIGAGAYDYPKDYLRTYKKATIDTVEIDSGLTKIAQKYFNLKSNPRMNIITQDGRIFLNESSHISQNQGKYDAIFLDAFMQAFAPPYQLTTLEATREVSFLLNKNGVLIADIAGKLDGNGTKLLEAEYNTYSKVFKNVYIFPVKNQQPHTFQNFILVATNSSKDPKSKDAKYQVYLDHLYKGSLKSSSLYLTDNFSPVEYYSYIKQ